MTAHTIGPTLTSIIERLADLADQGWLIFRVSRDLLRFRPHVFLARVRDAMRAAGRPLWGEVRLDARISWLDPAHRVWA